MKKGFLFVVVGLVLHSVIVDRATDNVLKTIERSIFKR